MIADVQIIEGGKLITTEKMKLKLVKEFNNEITIYENEDGQAIVHFKSKDEYVQISIDMA